MVFSSLPPYHHDPSNWQQQPNRPSGGGISNNTNAVTHVPPPPPPPPPPPIPPPPQPHGGSIRPGSMADRARMANIPMPEAALKCPRCESTNTKFCYFNNYSLTQPRHFCKTCRRYWTRGGALRTVPVGGGFRRNKRSSSSSKSKSAATSSSSSSAATSSSSSAPPPSLAAEILGLPPSLRFVGPPPLPHHPHHLAAGSLFLPDQYQFSGSGGGEIMPGGLGLYGPSYGSGGLDSLVGFNMAEQWRIPPPQYPFPATSSGITQQMASVKMEDSSSSRVQLLLDSHINNNNISEQLYWNIGGGGGGGGGGSGGGASSSSTTTSWTDLSAFTSSSATTNHQRL